MSKHESRVTGNSDTGFYALIVRIDYDGSENVIYGYKGRHFSTRAAALKSTSRYIEKLKQQNA